jgi:hypothetical protein
VGSVLAEIEHRIVDPLPDMCRAEKLPRTSQVAVVYCIPEAPDVAFFEIGDELRPRFESFVAGHGELGIGQFEGARRTAGVGADRPDACKRGRISLTSRTKELLRELALLFKIDDDLLQ